MNEFEIRIECLKLAHRADREAPEIVTRAKVFEEYVTKTPEAEKSEAASTKPGTLSLPKKK